MSLQILPKPSFSRTSNRKIHETESKALDVQLQENSWLLLRVQESSHLLNQHEVVLNKSPLDESTLIGRNHAFEPDNQSISQDFCYKLGKAVNEAYGSKVLCLGSSLHFR
jgi:hypothetical protein